MVKLAATTAVAFLATSAPALAAQPKLSVTWPASPNSAQVQVITAKLSPARSGVKLSLQQQAGSRWTTLASAKTNRKGIATMAARLSAGAAKLRVAGRSGARTVSSKVQALTVADGGSGGGGGSGPLFTPPGRDLTGQEAADRIVPYLGNSTFTDCVPGFPSCAVEYRYGHFASGVMFYCRLTNSSGSDIINGAMPFQIIGADMKADGSWGVTLRVISYGDAVRYYTWQVSTTGVAYANYWSGGTPGVDPPSSTIGPLQWVRGARDCSY